jgi:hypothetical protein
MHTFKFSALYFCFLFSVVALLASCSGNSYLNAIPGESTALISMDVQKLTERSHQNNTVLESILM